MGDVITRVRQVIDSAQWIDSSNGEIVEAVKLEHLDAVPMDDLADCAHALNGAMEARDVAVAHVRELEGQLAKALLREPTRDEMEAALGDKDEAFLGGTVRRCLDCRTPVFGGPTRCIQCAERVDVAAASARATEAEKRASEAEARVVSAAQESSTLRSKLAEAERRSDANGKSAIKAIKMLADTKDRCAALERAAREWDEARRGWNGKPIDHTLPQHEYEAKIKDYTAKTARLRLAETDLRTALDALTPAAAANGRATPCECGHVDATHCESLGEHFGPAAPAAKPATCGDCGKRNSDTGICSEFSAPARAYAGMCEHFARRLPVVAEQKPRAPYKTCGDCTYLEIAFGGVRGTCGAQHGRNGDSVFTSTAACSAFCGKPRPAAGEEVQP